MDRLEASRKVAEKILLMTREELQFELLRQEDTDTYLIFKKLLLDQKLQDLERMRQQQKDTFNTYLKVYSGV